MSEEYVFAGFEPANTTPVPDILFDQLLTELGCAELKVLLYIIRRTWGFKKNSDAISFNQFLNGITTKDGRVLDKGCGVKNRTVLSKALVDLEHKGYIASSKGLDPHGDKATTLYNIRFKSQEVVSIPYHVAIGGGINSVPPVVSETYHGSTENVPGVVSIPYLQETVIQLDSLQETVIQKDTDQNSANANSDDASSSFSLEDETQSPYPQSNEQLSSEDVDNTSQSDVETSLPEVPGEMPTETTTPTADETASIPATSPESPLNAKTEAPMINTSEQKSPIAGETTRTRPTYTKRSGKILIEEWYALFDELYRQLPGYLPTFEVPRGTSNTDAILSLINAGATREQAAFVFKDICSDDDTFWLKHRTITAVKSQFPTRVPKMNVKQRGKNVSIQQQLYDKEPDFPHKSQGELAKMMPQERKEYFQRADEHAKAKREQHAVQQVSA